MHILFLYIVLMWYMMSYEESRMSTVSLLFRFYKYPANPVNMGIHINEVILVHESHVKGGIGWCIERPKIWPV